LSAQTPISQTSTLLAVKSHNSPANPFADQEV
jgi:hypothetical protein